jgi:hypothetical protein
MARSVERSEGRNEADCSGVGLLGRPVRAHGLRLGECIDLHFDARVVRAVGLEVLCTDATRRFLPWVACDFSPRAIEAASAVSLLDANELGFYRSNGHALVDVRGVPVYENGRILGSLEDVFVGREGDVSRIVLGEDGNERELEAGRIERVAGRLRVREGRRARPPRFR